MKYEALRDVEQKISYNEYINVYAPAHFHRCIEMNYIISGSACVKLGSSECCIKDNEIAFIPSYHVHMLDTTKQTKSITFMIPYLYYSEFIKRGNNLHFFKLDDIEFNKNILKLIKGCNEQLSCGGDDILLQGYINLILGLISQHYEQFEYEVENNNLMREIIEYIDSHCQEKITLDELANHFTYSKYYFSRLFNKLFDCNINYYINQVRYNNFIKNFDLDKKITTQIEDNGFGDASTFYKLKKRQIDNK